MGLQPPIIAHPPPWSLFFQHACSQRCRLTDPGQHGWSNRPGREQLLRLLVLAVTVVGAMGQAPAPQASLGGICSAFPSKVRTLLQLIHEDDLGGLLLCACRSWLCLWQMLALQAV